MKKINTYSAQFKIFQNYAEPVNILSLASHESAKFNNPIPKKNYENKTKNL